jgi:hypothetical protein
MLCHLNQLEKLYLLTWGKELLKSSEQSNDANIFSILKGHSGSGMYKRLKQRVIKAASTPKQWDSTQDTVCYE